MRQEKKINSRKKQIRRLLCLFFLLAFMVTGYFVYRYYQTDKEQEDRFDQLEGHRCFLSGYAEGG